MINSVTERIAKLAESITLAESSYRECRIKFSEAYSAIERGLASEESYQDILRMYTVILLCKPVYINAMRAELNKLLLEQE